MSKIRLRLAFIPPIDNFGLSVMTGFTMRKTCCDFEFIFCFFGIGLAFLIQKERFCLNRNFTNYPNYSDDQFQ